MRKVGLWLLLSLLACTPQRGHLQKSPTEFVFGFEKVHQVSISTNGAYHWGDLKSAYRYKKDTYFSADIYFDGHALLNVGLKQKGTHSNAFAWTEKKPLKIKFDEFDKNRLFCGLNKINLANAFEDPSFQRDVVASHVFSSIGVSTPRAGFSEVYFNDTFWGLYVLIEPVDRNFLKRSFGETNGVLFKGISGCLVQASEADGKKHFERKTKGSKDGLRQLLRFINRASDDHFKDSIEHYLNVESFLKVMAYDLTSGNTDSYIAGRCHNFYLYQKENGQFEWIPWDYNLSFSAEFSVQDWKVPNFKNEGFSLLSRLMAIKTHRWVFYQECEQILKLLESKSTKRFLMQNHKMIEPFVERDSLAFYSFEQFKGALNQDISGGMANRIPGLFNLIEERRKSFEAAKDSGWVELP